MAIDRLRRSSALLEKLGNPHDTLRFVHVAGTNGKGSTSAFVSSILTQAGYKTGLFTSPYLVEFNERIRIDGRNISTHDLAVGREAAQKAAERMSEHPTEFEMMTAVAFSYFAQEKCDIVVCEAGVGGRCDATNVVEHPEVSVITSIGIDHQDVLGDTLEGIAWEKAGIIKSDSPAVSWPQVEEVQVILEQVTHDLGTDITRPDFTQLEIDEFDLDGQKFSYKEYKDLRIKLIAEYQVHNAVLAIEVIEVLRKNGWQISEAAIREGIAATSWPGRFEVVAKNPLVIVDGGHNVQAVQSLVSTLVSRVPDAKPVFIIGFLEDKDFVGMLEEAVRVASAFVVVEPPSPRALASEELVEALHAVWQGRIEVATSLGKAFKTARDLAGKEGVICSFGSIYSVAPLYQALASKPVGKA